MLSAKERMDIFYDILAGRNLEPKSRGMLHHSHSEHETAATLSSVIDRLGPLPPYTALLGICEDGLPLLVDLKDPSPGSILIQGDEHSGKTRLMRAYLLSAGNLNPADRVAISVISPVPGAFEQIGKLPNCRAVLSAYDRNASELIVELSALAEQRQYGKRHASIELLALQDLPELIQNNDYEVNAYLKWLIEHGPASGVCIIASVKSSQLWRLRNGFYECFGIYLTGSTNPAPWFADRHSSDHRALPGVFATQLGDEWVHFWSLQD